MTLEATLERIAAALESISRNYVGMNQSVPTPEAPPKRGPGRPTKEEAAAREAEKAAEEEARKADPFSVEEEPAPVLTIDEVRAALVDYQKRSGSAEKARAVLKQFGHSDTLKSLKPEHYAAVVAAATTA